jgi:hypothetical protein
MLICNFCIINCFQLPKLDLSASQELFVYEAFDYGKFFGQFSTVGSDEPLYDGLQGMGSELHDTYSTLALPPKLYQTNDKKLLGYYGVMHNANGGKLKKLLA